MKFYTDEIKLWSPISSGLLYHLHPYAIWEIGFKMKSPKQGNFSTTKTLFLGAYGKRNFLNTIKMPTTFHKISFLMEIRMVQYIFPSEFLNLFAKINCNKNIWT